MYLLLIAILILVNGLFVTAEMALVSSRTARLRAAADRGDHRARVAVNLIEHPARYFSTVQIVITLTGIALGMFGEASVASDLEPWIERVPFLAEHRHVVALILTVALLTFATLVFAELLPKRIGQMFPEGLARVFAPPLDLVGRLTHPLVWLLTWVTDQALRLVPVRPAPAEGDAEQEVKAIIASGTESGEFHESEQELVERVFRLSDQKATAIMVPRTDIDYLRVNDTIERVRVAVATSAHSHFPVCIGGLDDLIGVVHIKDLVKHGLISETVDLRALARTPMFVPESTPAISLLDRFRASGTHIAFVVDEYGSLMGLVTLNDLIEALVGQVKRGGPPEPTVVRRADGSYLIDGHVTVGELKSIMGVTALPREQEAGYETLGGFVMTQLGRIPATGDRFEVGLFEFEVVDMDRTRVDKVLLTARGESSEPRPRINEPRP